MLDKSRNMLISNAFRKANITSIESEPTEAEIEDAAHTLNAMLQSWNNDGFRLFKIKDGYMPFIPKKNDYSLATQAYKSIESTYVSRVDRIGATRLKLSNYNRIAPGQKIMAINDIKTEKILIKEVNYDVSSGADEVVLDAPFSFSMYNGDVVFYGNFNTASTQVRAYAGGFNTISFSGADVLPVVGDTIWFCYNTSWIRSTVTSVNQLNHTCTFKDTQQAGNITNGTIIYGYSVFSGDIENSGNRSVLVGDYLVTPRKLITSGFKDTPSYVSVVADGIADSSVEVETGNVADGTIILKHPISEDVLLAFGENKIIADLQYDTKQEVVWGDFNVNSLDIVTDYLDWGSIADSSDLQTDDWGYIYDAATTLEDWGTLVGGIEIVGFSKTTSGRYTLIKNTIQNVFFLFYDIGAGWQQIDLTDYNFSELGLFTAKDKSFLYDSVQGLMLLVNGSIETLYASQGIEKIISYKNDWYLVSPKASATITRTVVKTHDFVNFNTPYTIQLDSIDNPAEFQTRMFIGTTDTYVGDMQNFMVMDVYSQSRCVIGDRLINLNTSRVCSYTKDGVNFYPMPMMLSNQTAWGYKDGCSFIAVYGILNGGIVSTQIFTANDFNPTWTPQVVVPGRVKDIFFDEENAYFVSDVAVYSLKYREQIQLKEEAKCFCYGEQIGRPQQIMNVMKYGFDNQVELPLNALSLQEFTVLPRSGLGGEPVNYCFMREAEDGKMMVWGTPSKFGEYLKFSYVEPLTLLEGARSTPDFPDEYYEAVENGLAAELSTTYGAPIERQQALAARAQESKENAMLHDNEDATYNIVPNQRWL